MTAVIRLIHRDLLNANVVRSAVNIIHNPTAGHFWTKFIIIIITNIIITSHGLNARWRPTSDACFAIFCQLLRSSAKWLSSCRFSLHHSTISSVHSLCGWPLLFLSSIFPKSSIFSFLSSDFGICVQKAVASFQSLFAVGCVPDQFLLLARYVPNVAKRSTWERCIYWGPTTDRPRILENFEWPYLWNELYPIHFHELQSSFGGIHQKIIIIILYW